MQGNRELLERRKTAFLSSRRTPRDLLPIIADWIVTLSPADDCVMCGNQAPIERTVFDLLLENKVPTILVLAETLQGAWRDDMQLALDEGRLLIITHCDTSVHCVNVRSAFDRNILMLSLADKTVVGYCDEGGNLERALEGFGNITYLITDVRDFPGSYVVPLK